MVTKRKPRLAFVTEPLSTPNAICQPCYQKNINTELSPYTKESAFMHFNNIADKKMMRHVNRNIHHFALKVVLLILKS